FQAEDGIRDGHVTGVQTCALPILEACRQRELLSPSIDGDSRPRAPAGCSAWSQSHTSVDPPAQRIPYQLWNREMMISQLLEGMKIGRASCRERGGSVVVGGALQRI